MGELLGRPGSEDAVVVGNAVPFSLLTTVLCVLVSCLTGGSNVCANVSFVTIFCVLVSRSTGCDVPTNVSFLTVLCVLVLNCATGTSLVLGSKVASKGPAVVTICVLVCCFTG